MQLPIRNILSWLSGRLFSVSYSVYIPDGRPFFFTLSTGPINYSLDQAVQYFQEHYNQPLSIKEYAAAHNLSEGWFIQNFKQYTNSTPAQYLLSLRIHNAKVLLESTNYNVTEISNIIGYENPLYFSRIFKKQTGFSPSEYRKKIFSEDNSTHSVSIISPD